MPASSVRPRTQRSASPLILLLIALLAAAGLFASYLLASGGREPAGAYAEQQAPAQAEAVRAEPDLARGNRIPWQDGSYFLSGVNYPWYEYYGGDIATLSSVDPYCNLRFSSSFDYAAIDADFAELQARGAHVVRWWLFGDGRGAPEFDANRLVTGFDATFFDHMDQAMEIAARRNIYIIWTLWDFHAFQQANWLCGGAGLREAYDAAAGLPPSMRDALLAHLKHTQAAPEGWVPGSPSAEGTFCMTSAGGHRNIVTDVSPDGAQDTFFDNALIPMLQRYANNPNIIGWEIMNEPEWTLTINDYTKQHPQVQEPVDVEDMRAFFARFTDTVHQYAPAQYATVGSASLKFMGLGPDLESGIWNGLGFDYYGAHYYGWMDTPANNGDPTTIDYNSTQDHLDAPVVIGELPGFGGSAPVYLPNVRRSGSENSTLDLRYICTSYAPANEPPCNRSYTASIVYYNRDGTTALTETVTIEPYGRWSGVVPAGLGTFDGAARIISNGPIAATITQNGIVSGAEETTYTGQDQASKIVWLPRITNLGPHRSRIAVQNTGIHTATAVIKYYDEAGTEVANDTMILAPRGSALIDPLLPGALPGPPSGFQGSAIITGNRILVATAYELDPQLGSDAYNGEGIGYQTTAYLPSVRNWGADGDPTIYMQNPCCDTATSVISYYNPAGAMVANQTVAMPLYGSAVVHPQEVLPGGFEGSAIITSNWYPSAVMRSVTTDGSTNTTMLYAATQSPDQRLHFPVVHSLNGGSGQDTTFVAQNVNATNPITIWVNLNDLSGTTVYTNHSIVVQPRSQWIASASNLPGVPAGFNGTAEVLWPWPNGWSQGFPLLATAFDIDSAGNRSTAYRGNISHTQGWAVSPHSPEQLLEGIYNKNWAGALAWSYYDHGTGSWDDFQAAMTALDAAHPADVRIGQSIYTPEPTPGNGETATALAATNTPAYGNTATATAVAHQTGTPHPPCSSCLIIFTDVPPDHTFYESIRCLACGNILDGYADGTFRPGNLVTRGQLAKIVSNAANFQDDPGPQIFEDIPVGHTFYAWVNRLTNKGFMSGYPCGGPGEPCVEGRPYFRPGNNATRGQTSKVVASAAMLSEPAIGQAFEDVPPAHTFYEWIQRLASEGIMGGYPCGGPSEPCGGENRPYFRPQADVTRGQAAKIVANTFFPNCAP